MSASSRRSSRARKAQARPRQPELRSHCTIAFALDHLGDKWTLLVLRDLLFWNKRHFKDFLSSEEKIASNILSNRLRQLEATGLVTREPDPDSARSVVYAPTEKAIDLVPALLELTRWSAKYDDCTQATPQVVKRIATDRDALVAEIRSRLKRQAGGRAG
jgi:DNA-binding HxlR family transcriptional regulator